MFSWFQASWANPSWGGEGELYKSEKCRLAHNDGLIPPFCCMIMMLQNGVFIWGSYIDLSKLDIIYLEDHPS